MVAKTLFTAAAVGAATLGMVQAAPVTTDEIKALEIINQARKEVGQAPLAWDNKLKEDAHLWSGHCALVDFMDHAPASIRKGAGELISMVRTENPSNPKITHPLAESAKMWLSDKGNQQAFEGFMFNNVPGQLLSAKATHIGCASSGSKGIRTPVGNPDLQLYLYTVCRVHADIEADENASLASRQIAATSATGEMTYYTPGKGSCGKDNNEGDMVVALSAAKMANGANPNNNPLCGKQIEIHANGKTAKATVVDTCPPCAEGDVDVSPSVFQSLMGSLTAGRVRGVTWDFI